MVLEFGTFIIAAAFANVFVLVFADHFCLISSGQLVAKSPQRPPSRFVDDQCHVVSQKPVHTAHTLRKNGENGVPVEWRPFLSYGLMKKSIN